MTDVKSGKVAYFALSEVYGGNDAGFVHTHSIVYFLRKAGINVTLFTGAPRKKVCSDVDVVFVTLPRVSNIFRVSPLRYLRSFIEMWRRVKDADIIHERFHVNPIDLLFLGRKKYVLEVNDPAIELCTGIKRIVYKLLTEIKYDRADAIIVQTETLKDIVAKHTNTAIYVVPNGVDIAKFRPDVPQDARREYGLSDKDVLVTFAGSFREWHGVLDVVEAARRVPDAKFLMVGTGRLFGAVKDALDVKGVDNLILAGAVEYDELPGILAASDVLIAPFSTRGFNAIENYGFFWCPVKLFEYMASGKPVVSYDFPEVRKIVNGCGLLAKPGNLDEFVTNLRVLVRKKDLRVKLGNNALSVARKHYSWNLRTEEIIKLYQVVLNRTD